MQKEEKRELKRIIGRKDSQEALTPSSICLQRLDVIAFFVPFILSVRARFFCIWHNGCYPGLTSPPPALPPWIRLHNRVLHQECRQHFCPQLEPLGKDISVGDSNMELFGIPRDSKMGFSWDYGGILKWD